MATVQILIEKVYGCISSSNSRLYNVDHKIKYTDDKALYLINKLKNKVIVTI